MVRVPRLTTAVSSKLSVVVATKHAKVASKASYISRDEKPSRYASGKHTMACRAVKIVHETISLTLDLPLQEA